MKTEELDKKTDALVEQMKSLYKEIKEAEMSKLIDYSQADEMLEPIINGIGGWCYRQDEDDPFVRVMSRITPTEAPKINQNLSYVDISDIGVIATRTYLFKAPDISNLISVDALKEVLESTDLVILEKEK